MTNRLGTSAFLLGLLLTYQASYGQTWQEISKLLPPPSNSENQKFGKSISINGDLAIIGSQESQAAFILEFNGTSWDHLATLTATDAGPDHGFGRSVAISDDVAFVGAPLWKSSKSQPQNGAVYVYEKPGGGWSDMTETTQYFESGPSFGISLSLSGDLLAAGAPGYSSNQGGVYLFEKKPSGWSFLSASGRLIAPDRASGNQLGTSVSVSGGVILAGSHQNGTGVAYIYEEPALGWRNFSTASKLTPSDASQLFGFSVTLSGDVALVGAYGDDTNGNNSGSAYLFEKPGGGWSDMNETAKLTPSDAAADDEFGFSVSLSGDVAVIGSPLSENSTSNEGASYLFEKPGGGWATGNETSKFTSGDNDQEDNFGIALGISGDRVLIGAYQDDESETDAGGAYYFEKPGGGWVTATEDQKILPASGLARGDNFGYALAIDGTTAVVGAPLNDQDVDAGGVAYVMELISGEWTRVATLSSSEILTTGASSRVGWTVDISGDVVVVGSTGAGAYLFEQPGGGWQDMTETAILQNITGTRGIGIDGNIAVVAETNNAGEILLFEKPGGGWADMSATASLTTTDGSEFWSVSISGDVITGGAPLLTSNQGAAYVYQKPVGAWASDTETAILTSSDAAAGDWFGYSIAIEGSLIVVGAFRDITFLVANAGSAYLYEKPGGGWVPATENAKLINLGAGANDEFGSSVDISGDWIIVGAPSEDEFSLDVGAAYLFQKPMGGWITTGFNDYQVRISHVANGDRFGQSVGISGTRLLGGTALFDEAGLDAGAVFYFSYSESPTSTGISDLNATEDGADVSVNLYDAFEDAEDVDADLEFEIDVEKPQYFSNISFVPPDLNFSLAPNAFGTSRVTVDAIDTDGKSAQISFFVIIDPVPDDPSIGDLATTYGEELVSGFNISANPVDISSVTHFKITSISGGSLYINSPSNPVSDGDFITDSDKQFLKFTPVSAGVGGFTIQASVSNDDSGLGGSQASTTITIAKADLTATANDLNKTYGDANPTFTVTYSGFVRGDDLIFDDASDLNEEPAGSTTATQFSDVGEYDITLSGGSDDNYTLTLVDGALTVDKATLNATPDDLMKEYGDPNPTLTISYTGFMGTDDAADIDTPPGLTTDATQFSPVNSYDIDAAGGSDNNYDINNVTNGTLLINRAPLTLTADDQINTYGDAIPELTYTFNGFKGTDDVIDNPPTLQVNATQFSAVGDYPITLWFGGSDNNYLVSFVDGTLTIDKKILTATADDKIFGLGQPLPQLTITYSGLVLNQGSFVIDTPPTISTTGTATSPAGEYPITLSGGMDENYDFILVDGTLTITGNLVLTVEADDQVITYGDPIPDLTFTYSGFVDSDGPSDIDTEPDISTDVVQFDEAGDYFINLSDGNDDKYELILVNGFLTVNKAILTATAEDKLVGFNQPFPAFTISYSGFVADDDESDLDFPPIPVPNANVGSPAGEYIITPQGGVDNNYTYTYINGTLAILEDPILTITPNDLTVFYGDPIPDFTLNYSGFLGGDDATVIDILPIASGASQFSGAGTYNINLSGGSDDLYVFQFGIGILTIKKAPLAATADDQARVFGQENPEFTITYVGLKGTDDESEIDLPPSVTTSAAVESNVGEYDIILEGGNDNNYELSLTDGILTISKAEATVTLEDLEQIADGTPKEVMVITDPLDLTVDVTYDGNNSPPVEPGEYAVVAAVNELNYQGSTTGTFVLSVEGVTGITLAPPDDIKIYPNPVQARLKIELGSNTKAIEFIRLLDMTGSEVLFQTFPPKWKEIELEFSGLNAGIYLLWLKTNDGYNFQKILKER